MIRRTVAAYGLMAGLVAASLWIIGVPGLFSGAPWPWLAIVAALALFAMTRRITFAWLLVATIGINAVLLSLTSGRPTFELGPLAISQEGLLLGAVGGLRLVALLGINMAALQRTPPSSFIDDLRLPARATAFLAAVLIAVQDIGGDFERMKNAAIVEGRWPSGRRRRADAAARMMPGLMMSAHRRAHLRSDALQLAGTPVGPNFAPIVAVTALGLAGRLALVAFPNVALTFAIVFVAGVAYGKRIAIIGAMWAMILSNLALSGFYLPAFVNVPAMMCVAWLGGSLQRMDWGSREKPAAIGVLAAAIGVLATFAFSVAADTLTWAVIAENRASFARLQVGILAGLGFNVLPAIINGMLFAISVGPVARAFAALRGTPHRQ